MTDNNAETRILTRMLKSTLGKMNHNPLSHFHALHSIGEKDGIKRVSAHPSIAAVLQQKRARDEKAAAAIHTKHSRIPSTSLGATVSKNNQQIRNQRASMTESNIMKASFARSPSGLLLSGREKYLDEDVTKPVDPKPLLSIHLPNSGRGRPGEKSVELPNVHKKSKSKNKRATAAAGQKSKHGLEKLSSRYGGGGGATAAPVAPAINAATGGGGGGASSTRVEDRGVDNHKSILVKKEVHTQSENVIKMPPIHKENIQKNLRRVRIDNEIQQVAFS